MAASSAFGVIEMQEEVEVVAHTDGRVPLLLLARSVGLVLVAVLSRNLEDIPLGWDPARYELTGLTLYIIPVASQQLRIAIFKLLETFVCRSSACGRTL